VIDCLAGVSAGCRRWATIHDRGTVEGWPPLSSAVPHCQELSIPHILAFAPGAGRAMGMVAGPGASSPASMARPTAKARSNLSREEISLSYEQLSRSQDAPA
jgi:hypothetical protein